MQAHRGWKSEKFFFFKLKTSVTNVSPNFKVCKVALQNKMVAKLPESRVMLLDEQMLEHACDMDPSSE